MSSKRAVKGYIILMFMLIFYLVGVAMEFPLSKTDPLWAAMLLFSNLLCLSGMDEKTRSDMLSITVIALSVITVGFKFLGSLS